MRRAQVTVGFLLVVMLFVTIGAAEATTISIWSRNPFMEEIIEGFNAKMEAEGEDIQAEFTIIPGHAGMIENLVAAVIGGVAPDVVSSDLIHGPYFSSEGVFVSLTERAEQLPFYDHLAWRMGELGKLDDEIFLLPYWSDNSALFYNKDIFDAAGMDYPDETWTWNEFREAAIALTTDDHYGLVLPAGERGTIGFVGLPFLWSNGAMLITDDGRDTNLDSPEAIEALEFLRQLVVEDKVTQPTAATDTWNDIEALWYMGQTAMILSGNWNVASFTEYGMNFGTTLIPRAPGANKRHSSFLGGDLIGITSQSRHPEEAWRFIEYSLSEEVQVDVFARNGMIPIRSDVFDNVHFQEEPLYRAFALALEVGRCPWSTRFNEAYEHFPWAVQKTLMGELSAEEAFTQAAQLTRRVLQR